MASFWREEYSFLVEKKGVSGGDGKFFLAEKGSSTGITK
jgi:hypothetical protein